MALYFYERSEEILDKLIKTKEIYNKLKAVSDSVNTFDIDKIKEALAIMNTIVDGQVISVNIEPKIIEMYSKVGNKEVRHLIFNFQYKDNLEESVNYLTMAYYLNISNGKYEYNNMSDLIRALITI